MSISKQVIVIGATGAVGSALLSLLIADNTIDKVLVFSRRPLAIKHEKLTCIEMDFEQLANYQPQILGDTLYSCLGTTKAKAGSITNQRIIDFDYQLGFAQMAAKNGVKNYVLVSSAGANAFSSNPYFKMKGELEQQVAQLNFNNTHIVRPSLLLAKRDHFRLGEWLAGKILPVICWLPGLRKYRPIHVEQVARKMKAVVDKGKEGLHHYTLSEVFKMS